MCINQNVLSVLSGKKKEKEKEKEKERKCKTVDDEKVDEDACDGIIL